MSVYRELETALKDAPRTWLLTGVAGFIASNLLEKLLKLEQRVIGFDNFSTGHRRNLDQVRAAVQPEQWARFELIEGDVVELDTCRRACSEVDYILHHAALASVPASMAEPLAAHQSNVTGFLNLMVAAREAKVRRLIYASSSAVYGDDPEFPKRETKSVQLLSPYAANKAMNEMYAEVFARAYGFDSIGLRYFNVFGPRQDPEGAYAAVIPKWIAALLKREPVYVNGDGETTRDFCHIGNVVHANLLAATATPREAVNQVYNIAMGRQTSLNELFEQLQRALRQVEPGLPEQKPIYRAFRPGDVRHSVADISKAQRLLGYAPEHNLEQGLVLAMEWYRGNV